MLIMLQRLNRETARRNVTPSKPCPPSARLIRITRGFTHFHIMSAHTHTLPPSLCLIDAGGIWSPVQPSCVTPEANAPSAARLFLKN